MGGGVVLGVSARCLGAEDEDEGTPFGGLGARGGADGGDVTAEGPACPAVPRVQTQRNGQGQERHLAN